MMVQVGEYLINPRHVCYVREDYESPTVRGGRRDKHTYITMTNGAALPVDMSVAKVLDLLEPLPKGGPAMLHGWQAPGYFGDMFAGPDD